MPAPLRLGVLNEPGGALVLVDAERFMVVDFGDRCAGGSRWRVVACRVVAWER